MVAITPPTPSWAQQPNGPAPAQGQPATPAQPAVPPPETLQSKLTRWFQIKEKLADLNAQESALRQELFRQAFPNAKEKGTERVSIGHGKDLKVTTKLNYSASREKLASYGDNVLPPSLRNTVFRYKPEVVEAELAKALADKTLPPETKAALADIVTSKPAMPALEIADSKKGA